MRASSRRRVPSAPARPVAFVTDLDRTLQWPGRPPSATARRAVRAARALGLRTVLVTGREYAAARSLATGFGRWDAIVAENGAVVEAPWGAPPTVVGRRTAAEVRRRVARHPHLLGAWGEVVFSVPAAHRHRLEALVAGLPVRVTANVDRLMVLPSGVTKLSGVRRALRQLGLAGRPFAAVGDAENDVELLRGAAFAATVANGRPEVRRVADYVARAPCGRGVWEVVHVPLRRRMGEAD
jgi:hydroxymethylpyrimidine pyrophosphatase-like HAD family hydrolase